MYRFFKTYSFSTLILELTCAVDVHPFLSNFLVCVFGVKETPQRGKKVSCLFENISMMKGARIAVETDTKMLKIAETLACSAASTGAKTTAMIIEPTRRHGDEPPKPVAEAMKAADVVLAPTYLSLSHTDARRNATKQGARIASMPSITEDMMRAGGLTADYRKVASLTNKVATLVQKCSAVTVSTPSGTILKMSIKERLPDRDTGLFHKPGDFGNLPAGEVALAPVEGSTSGTLVIDYLVSTAMGLSVTQPIKVAVKDGRARSLVGPDAAKLKSILEAADKNAYSIAELGIGTNPKAHLIGNTLEDEKVLGTVHIALGDNTSFIGDTSKAIFT
jgi:leucyl aminopeptidase (aminopeptidase T)